MTTRLLCVLLAGLVVHPCAADPTRALLPAGLMQAFRSALPLPSASGTRPGTSCLPGEPDAFELIDIDTLFYVDNRGLERLFVNVNGHAFKLVTDSTEIYRSNNAFWIPLHGPITINISAYITPGNGNCMAVRSQGPPGADADLIVGDLLVPGQQVAYAVTGLTPMPRQLELLQGYPNPFRDAVHISYTIPEHRTTGMHVVVDVYDARGRRVRTLVDDWRYPGRFAVTWDGFDDAGRPVGSGTYLCRMDVDDAFDSIQLVRIR